MIERCAVYSEIYLFADDAKLVKHNLSDRDRQELQKGVNELYEWTTEWLLKLNISKCKAISIGRNVDKTRMYNITDNDCDVPIGRVDIITDPVILIDEKLPFKEHIHDKINKAYRMLGLIIFFSNISQFRVSHYCTRIWTGRSVAQFGHHTERVISKPLQRFKRKPQRFCPNLNFSAEIYGTGNRSEVVDR